VWEEEKLNLNLCLNMICQSFNIKKQTVIKMKTLLMIFCKQMTRACT
jgi:hypothetical protein